MVAVGDFGGVYGTNWSELERDNFDFGGGKFESAGGKGVEGTSGGCVGHDVFSPQSPLLLKEDSPLAKDSLLESWIERDCSCTIEFPF